MAFRSNLPPNSNPEGNELHGDALLVDGNDVDAIELLAEEPPRKCDPIIGPAYSIPVVNAGVSSVKTALGLVERNHGYTFIASVSGVNFLVMMGMNFRYTMDGIRGTVSYLRTRTVPSSWVPISDGKNAIALSLALLTAVTKAGTDGILNRYFVMRLPVKFNFSDKINMPGWEALGWTTSVFTFVGTISSGGMTMYVKLRNALGGKQPEYTCRASRYLGPPVGATLSLVYAIGNFSGTVVSVTSTFGITSVPGIIGVCGLSMVNAVNSQFTSIPFNINCVDKFFGSFVEQNGKKAAYKDPYTIVSFTFAMAAAGLIAYSSRALTKVLINHSLEIVGVNCSSITDPIVDGIATSTIGSNLLWVGGALTPLFYGAAKYAVSTVTKCCSRPQLSDRHIDGESLLVEAEALREVEPLLDDAFDSQDNDAEFSVAVEAPPVAEPQVKPQQTGSMHRLFQPQDAGATDEHPLARTDKAACVIL